MEYSTQGKHIICDAWGINREILNDAKLLAEMMQLSASICGATVLGVQFKQFEPQGATVLLLLSESHLSCHTYPEAGFAAFDAYTCGNTIDPQIALDYLMNILEPETKIVRNFARGIHP